MKNSLKWAMALLIVSLLALTSFALAEETPHKHVGDDSEYRPWGDKLSEQTHLPSDANDYKKIYLTHDIELNDTWMPIYPVEICLNGHTISMNKKEGTTGAYNIIDLSYGVKVDLIDCTGKGTINGEGKYRCIYVSNNSLHVENIQLVNGKAQSGSGGAICLSENNTAIAHTVELKNVTVKNCESSASGGGIYLGVTSRDTVNLDKVIVKDCNASANGGGVLLNGNAKYTVNKCTFSNNTSNDNGGGLAVLNADVALDKCTVNNNTAKGSGGGVYVTAGANGSGTNAKLTLRNETSVTGNKTTSYVEHGGGGGLALLGSSTGVLESSSTITNNTGYYNGGGIFVGAGATAELMCTVTGNRADGNGGGAYVDYKSGTPGIFKVYGSASVNGNTSGYDGKNVRLNGNAKVTVAGALNTAAKFGVSSNVTLTKEQPTVVITKGYNDTDPSAHFTSDSSASLINKDNEVALHAHFHDWEFDTTNAIANYPNTPSVKVYCKDDTCTYSEAKSATVKIYYSWTQGKTLEYNHQAAQSWPFGVRMLEENANPFVKAMEIKYYKDDSTTAIEGIPSQIGTYQAKAEVKIQEHPGADIKTTTLLLNFEILAPAPSGDVESRGTLPYAGEQDLVREINVEHGTPMYYVSTRELDNPPEKNKVTEETAKGTNPGTYYIYWYIKGDTTDSTKPYRDTEIQGPLVATITEKHDHTVGKDTIHFAPWPENNNTSVTSLPTKGAYYLTADITYTGQWDIAENETVNLCLNGHTINFPDAVTSYDTGIYVHGGATLNLFDCQDTGKLYGNNRNIAGVKVNAGGTFNMYGGTITGFRGNGVYLVGQNSGHENAIFNLHGGTIESGLTADATTTTGPGVVVKDHTSFVMEGGKISGFQVPGTQEGGGGGVRVLSGGSFKMRGGEISGNKSLAVSGQTGNGKGEGGGVSVYGGNATISGGIITGNTATVSGGGVAVLTYTGKLTLTGGEITGNIAKGGGWSEGGGGIYVETNGAALSISGALKVTGNTSPNTHYASENNVFLRSNVYIQIADTLNNGAILGITRETNNSGQNQSGVFTSDYNSKMSGVDPAQYFKADDPNYYVEKDGDEAKLARHSHSWTVSKEGQDTAKIKCTALNCPYETGMEYIVAIQAKDREAVNGGKYPATVINELPGVVTTTLNYYFVNGNGDWQALSGGISVPESRNHYKATVSFNLGGQHVLSKEYYVYSYAEATVTKKTDLYATDSNQELVDVSFESYTTGAVCYSVNGGEWKECTYTSNSYVNVPSAAAAGTYEIKYWIKSGHDDYRNKGNAENPVGTLTVTIWPQTLIYYVQQSENGGWVFPTEGMKSDGTTQNTNYNVTSVPQTLGDAFQIAGYSLEAPTADFQTIPEGGNIDLSSKPNKLYIYFSRNERKLNFYDLPKEGQEPQLVRTETVLQGAHLAGFSDYTRPVACRRFAGWTTDLKQSKVYELATQLPKPFDFNTATVGALDINLYPMYTDGDTFTATFEVENGQWDDEIDGYHARFVALYSDDINTPRLAAEQIPKVGNKPDNGYTTGSWNTEPDTETVFTDNVTYTYTYAQKTDPTVNASGGSGLVYNGQEQALLIEGSVEGGTLYYAVTDNETAPDKETYSEAVPTKKDAGNYYAWYYVKGDANHNDTEPTKLMVSIAKKPLTVTAEAKTKVEGEADPALTYTTDGLVGTDQLTGALTRDAGEAVGSYQITQGDLSAGNNYDMKFVGANLTITAKPVQPETQPTQPETQPTQPETQPTQPETQPSQPAPVTPAEPAPVSVDPYGVLIATCTSTGDYSINAKWNAVRGADGYDVFFTTCGDYSFKHVATVPAGQPCSYDFTDLRKYDGYKVIVKAWQGASRNYIEESPVSHCYTGGGTKKQANPASLTLKKTAQTIKLGKTATVGATLTGVKKGKIITHDGKVRYISADPSVVEVTHRGKLRAVGAGSCTVYVLTTNGIYKTVTVTVDANPTRVKISKAMRGMKVGQTQALGAKVVLTPAKAVTSLTWTSSKPEVVSVDAYGNVTALSKGRATITVTTANGKKTKLNIRVK